MKSTYLPAARSALIAACTAGAVLMFAGTQAFGHASLEQAQSPSNAMYKAVMRIPHGCDGEATHTVTVSIPDGVIAAKPMPKAGWTLSTEVGPYDKTYDYYGTPLSEGVRTIVWSDGNLDDGHYDEFVFRARITDMPSGDRLFFPTVQDCAGSTVAWTEIAAPGQDAHDLERPAPVLLIAGKADHGHGHGHGVTSSAGIAVDAPFARATPGMARNGAAYLTVRNTAGHADRLVAARAGVSSRVELHTHINDGGVMRMREVDGIDVPAGGTAELKPGGYHIMFIGLEAPLIEGETFPVTLVFEKAGEITVEVPIGPVGAGSAGHGGHNHGGHNHGGHKHN